MFEGGSYRISDIRAIYKRAATTLPSQRERRGLATIEEIEAESPTESISRREQSSAAKFARMITNIDGFHCV